ncbi:MAG: peptidoglycan bridge formation glycyltransferase FemA/FemB family protein [Erysipelotrichaceae bacterium]
MTYKFIKNISECDHDNFVESSDYCNLLQSSKWSKIKNNWQHLIVGVESNNTLVASTLILIKPLPLGMKMLYIPKGPVLDYNNLELLSFILDNIKKLGKELNAIYIKMDPPVHRSDYPMLEEHKEYDEIPAIMNTFKASNAKHMGYYLDLNHDIQPRFQANVYYHDNWELDFSKKMTKDLKIAEKKNLELEIGSLELLDEFARLMNLTQERKQIHLRDKDYFKKLLEVYGDDAQLFMIKLNTKKLLDENKAKLIAAKKELEGIQPNAKKKLFTLEELIVSLDRQVTNLENEVKTKGDVSYVAGSLCIKYGYTSEILYAGMDDTYKRYMGPTLAFISPMRYNFSKGCKSCNMGGLHGDFEDGLSKFKNGYHPTINEYIGEFDIVINSFMYKVFNLALKLRKIIRR